MKKASLPWKASQYKNMYLQGSLSDDYPIQRAGEQWSGMQKSLFIHSLIESYPIPNVLLLKVKDDDKTYILDGKQRLSTIINFLSGEKLADGSYPENAFKLDDETPTARVDVGGEDKEFEISGKYYDELPSEVQDEVRTSIISVTRLEDATDEEIEELFYRWNNGTALTDQQKNRVLMGTKNAIIFDTLVKHPLMKERASLTPLQRRRAEDEGVILQAMMLLSGYDFKSFVSKQMNAYAESTREEDITEIVELLKASFDYLYENTSSKSVLFKKLHLPVLIMIGINAMDGEYSDKLMDDWILDFSMAINAKTKDNARIPTDYNEYMGAGSVRKSKVDGRLNAMQLHFAEFAKEYIYGDVEDMNEDDNTSENVDSDASNEDAQDGTSEPSNAQNESTETISEQNNDGEEYPFELETDDSYSQKEEYEENSVQLTETK